jgi:hypothetical protein
MEKKFKDKKSRPSSFGKRNEGDKSFDKKKSFGKNEGFAKKSNSSFDKKDSSFRKKSGIRTPQSKEYDIEQLTGTKPRKTNFKPRNNNKKDNTNSNNDHYYGKPYEKREKSLDKP